MRKKRDEIVGFEDLRSWMLWFEEYNCVVNCFVLVMNRWICEV